MTSTEIVDRILKRIDDDTVTPVSVTEPEALAAANEGQEFFAWLTLCLETTAPLTLPASTTHGVIRATFPDFLCPLRITVNGSRLRPSTFGDLDMINDQWQATTGPPERYVTQGFNYFAVTPQQAFDLVSQWTYARSPRTMADGDTPEIPEAYHPDLVNYGIYRVKLKEGGQSLQRGIGYLNKFLDSATEHGDFVRARSRAARYDTFPFELKLFDRARLIDLVKKRRAAPPATNTPAAAIAAEAPTT